MLVRCVRPLQHSFVSEIACVDFQIRMPMPLPMSMPSSLQSCQRIVFCVLYLTLCAECVMSPPPPPFPFPFPRNRYTYCMKLHKKEGTFRFSSWRELWAVATDWRRIRRFLGVALPGGAMQSIEALNFEVLYLQTCILNEWAPVFGRAIGFTIRRYAIAVAIAVAIVSCALCIFCIVLCIHMGATRTYISDVVVGCIVVITVVPSLCLSVLYPSSGV